MNRLLVALILLVAMGLTSSPSPVSAQPLEAVIVVFHDSVTNSEQVANQMAQQHAFSLEFTYQATLKGFAARIPAQRLSQIQADARVQFVSQDRTVQAFAQTLPAGVNRIDADNSSTLAGNGAGSVQTAIAIIDTGIDLSHTDLNVAGGKNCVRGKNSYDDGNGHGTHVAGTVAALDNGIGVVGVAPGAPVYAVRVLDNRGSGTWSSVICGIDWVTQNAESLGIKVANMSLGGSGSDDNNCGNSNNDALHKAVCGSVSAGVTYVVAAGNSNADLATFVPASYNEVLTVTAMADFNGQSGGGAAATCRTDVDDTAADFSNFTTKGSSDEGHTISAPGVCILSSWHDGGYNTISGTSMASPHVAGVVALCLASGGCSGAPAQIIMKLRSDAATQPASYGFAEDAHQVNPSGSRYYGYLVYSGGY